MTGVELGFSTEQLPTCASGLAGLARSPDWPPMTSGGGRARAVWPSPNGVQNRPVPSAGNRSPISSACDTLPGRARARCADAGARFYPETRIRGTRQSRTAWIAGSKPPAPISLPRPRVPAHSCQARSASDAPSRSILRADRWSMSDDPSVSAIRTSK